MGIIDDSSIRAIDSMIALLTQDYENEPEIETYLELKELSLLRRKEFLKMVDSPVIRNTKGEVVI